MIVWIGLLVVVGVVGLEGKCVSEEETGVDRIDEILQSVKHKDRQEFIRYHLQKGHELVKQQEENTKYPGFNINIGDDDSILLYKYFATNYQVHDETVVSVARNVICWNDKCIDISDPGIHP